MTGKPVSEFRASALLVPSVGMSTREPSWSERIRDLIEQVDRVRDESERVRGHAEHAMKHPIWPDRRRTRRVPASDDTLEHHRGDR